MRNRRGAALLTALLLLFLLELLAAALLVIGTQHRSMVRGQADAWQARAAAEGAVRLAAGDWSSGFDTLGFGDSATAIPAAGTLPDGTAHGARVERLRDGSFLLAGEGVTRTGAAANAFARVRTADPLRMWADFPAAFAGGADVELLAGAVLDGANAGTPPGWGSAECSPIAALERSMLLGAGPLPAVLADTGAIVVLDSTALAIGGIVHAPVHSAPFAFDGLGGLRMADLARLADHHVAGIVTPGPSAAGAVCDLSNGNNWGDPLTPSSACGDYRPLIHAPGDLHIDGGTGQGVLAVAGDLVVTGGFEFRGAVVVRGHVAWDGVAWGAVRAGGVSRLAGRIHHSDCALWRALHSPSVGRPFRTAERWWLPAF